MAAGEPSFTARIEAAWALAAEHPLLALVPLVTALTNTTKLRRVLGFDGTHVGIQFGFPVSVVDLWAFVSVPNSGFEVYAGVPLATPAAFVVVPLAVLFRAVLSAGYFGGLRNLQRADPVAFVAAVREYVVSFLGYQLAQLGLLAPFALLAAGGRAAGPLLLLALPVIVGASYLFFATPYILVRRDVGLGAAAKRSYALARAGGPYAAYAFRYLAFVVAVSVFVTAVVVNLGPVGLLLGVPVGALLGFTLNLATMDFVMDIDARTGGEGSENAAESGVSPGVS
jgi:hypothetical protein